MIAIADDEQMIQEFVHKLDAFLSSIVQIFGSTWNSAGLLLPAFGHQISHTWHSLHHVAIDLGHSVLSLVQMILSTSLIILAQFAVGFVVCCGLCIAVILVKAVLIRMYRTKLPTSSAQIFGSVRPGYVVTPRDLLPCFYSSHPQMNRLNGHGMGNRMVPSKHMPSENHSLLSRPSAPDLQGTRYNILATVREGFQVFSTITTLFAYLLAGEHCSICQVKFSLHSRIDVLDCLHAFHAQCIRDWSKASKTCPKCGKPVATATRPGGPLTVEVRHYGTLA